MTLTKKYMVSKIKIGNLTKSQKNMYFNGKTPTKSMVLSKPKNIVMMIYKNAEGRVPEDQKMFYRKYNPNLPYTNGFHKFKTLKEFQMWKEFKRLR